MKSVFIVPVILATSFSYGMDQNPLKGSPHLSLSRQTSAETSVRPTLAVPPITRARAHSQESPRFIHEENIMKLIPKDQQDSVLSNDPFARDRQQQYKRLSQILTMKEAQQSDK